MSRIRIYCKPEGINDTLTLDDVSLLHKMKNVLRLKVLDTVFVFDGEGIEYRYQVRRIEKSKLIIEKTGILRSEKNITPMICLAFPLMKESKVTYILQKATELGVYRFLPFICQRNTALKKSKAKLSRWRKIVIEATQQSNRVWLPMIEETRNLEDILDYDRDCGLVGYPRGMPLRSVLGEDSRRYKKFLVLVGPEGDFTNEELDLLRSKNFFLVNFSKNILRSETAAIFFVGILHYFYNES